MQRNTVRNVSVGGFVRLRLYFANHHLNNSCLRSLRSRSLCQILPVTHGINAAEPLTFCQLLSQPLLWSYDDLTAKPCRLLHCRSLRLTPFEFRNSKGVRRTFKCLMLFKRHQALKRLHAPMALFHQPLSFKYVKMYKFDF